MDFEKYCDEIGNIDPPLFDVPVVYLPCPHKYYKSKVVNRTTLTHEQHTDLLATPKGFCWDKSTGLASPPKRKANNGSIVKAPLCVTDYRYLRDFITDVWNVIDPKYLKKLGKILVKEYGMSESEAKEFLEEQRLRSAFSNRKPQCKINLSPRHDWVKDIADVLAGKLTNYLNGMLNARRTRKVRFVAEAILEGFGDLTGEKCSLENPQNKIQNMQVFAADRLAVWLSYVLGDYEQELCREVLKDAQGEYDSLSDSDSDEGYDEATGDQSKEEDAFPAEPQADAEEKSAKEPKAEEGEKPSEGSKTGKGEKPPNEPEQDGGEKPPDEVKQGSKKPPKSEQVIEGDL